MLGGDWGRSLARSSGSEEAERRLLEFNHNMEREPKAFGIWARSMSNILFLRETRNRPAHAQRRWTLLLEATTLQETGGDFKP